MNIETIIKQQYGNDREYIKTPSIAEAVSVLTNRKTIDASDKAAIQQLIEVATGQTVEFVQVVN